LGRRGGRKGSDGGGRRKGREKRGEGETGVGEEDIIFAPLHAHVRSYVTLLIISHVSSRAHDVLPVSSTSIQCIGPCVMYLMDCFTELLLGSQFLFGAWVCTFCVIFCGLKAHSHSDGSHQRLIMQLLRGHYIYEFTHTCPIISCIPLV